MRPRVQLTGDLETFFELSPDLCCVMAADGTIQASNPAWFGVLGYDAVDVENHRFTDFVHPDERERVAHAMIEHERSLLAARLRHKDGSYRRLRWWTMAALETQRIYAIGRDEVSGFANAERLLSLGQIALGIVHDLKNVLVHPLGLQLQRVERAVETQSKDKARSAIKAMRLVLDDGVTAIDRMLQYTQPAAKRTRAKVDVENIVWRATEIARAYARGLTSSNEIALAYEQGKPKKLECDAFELLASLVNVMFNAIDAVADKGGNVSVKTGVSAKRVWLEIVDDGPGMSDEVRARLFEPFFTTKTGGVGIGLAMVKSCIESHNGTIAVDSTPTGGTTFRIELPMG
jgi:PAS domain S-box-containing protein